MHKSLLFLVRHGTTMDSKLKIFRGQRDSALDKAGFRDAHVLREFLDQRPWRRIFCSSMTRAIQTATIICDDQEDNQPETTDGFEPWNIGFLTGLPKNEANRAKMDYFVEHPEEGIEGGESRREFEHRVWPLIAEAIQLGWIQDCPCVIVAHSSVIHALNHLMEGESHKDVAVKPAGIVEVYLDGSEIKHRAIFRPGTDDSSFEAKQHPSS
jgi:broad specificity phosphatase PhoE